MDMDIRIKDNNIFVNEMFFDKLDDFSLNITYLKNFVHTQEKLEKDFRENSSYMVNNYAHVSINESHRISARVYELFNNRNEALAGSTVLPSGHSDLTVKDNQVVSYTNGLDLGKGLELFRICSYQTSGDKVYLEDGVYRLDFLPDSYHDISLDRIEYNGCGGREIVLDTRLILDFVNTDGHVDQLSWDDRDSLMVMVGEDNRYAYAYRVCEEKSGTVPQLIPIPKRMIRLASSMDKTLVG